jgi:hypothetical protein
MEASEKPQQELDLADAAVRALDDRLVIESLTVSDARAARVVRERAEAGQPPPKTVADAIEIGARVLEREGLASEVDYVQREFERTASQVRREFGDQAGNLAERVEEQLERVFGGESGMMARALDAHAEELAEQVARHFDPERQTAVQNQVRELVASSLQDSREALVRHLSSDDGSNPLADFKAGVRGTVVEAVRKLQGEEVATRDKLEKLQQDIVRLTEQAEAKKQLAEAEEAGTRKGRTFEERVHFVLDQIAEARGDAAQHVGDERAEAGGKKGDALVEIGAAHGAPLGRLVIEAKDERLSKNRAWQELNEAMQQRDASFAVLVVAGQERIPAGREQLHEYEGNKMIVAVDREEPDGLALEVAYRYARCRVLMSRDRELTLDAAGVRNAAEEAISALKKAQSIRLALTGATDSVDKARSGLDDMTDAVRERLEHIESLVAAADQEQ